MNSFSEKYNFDILLEGGDGCDYDDDDDDDTHADVDFDVVLEGGTEDCDSSPEEKVERHNEQNVRAVCRVVSGKD